MVRGDTAVFLYGSIHSLPKGQIIDLRPFSTVYHIVRGSRPDARRGVRRLPEGSTATRIIPDVDLAAPGALLVDFDGSLFGRDQQGVWKETEDGAVLDLYRDYRENSSHFSSIRPYRKGAQNGVFSPTESCLENLNFQDGEPMFKRIKELK